MTTTLTEAVLHDRYDSILAFYDHFLDTPDGRAAPKRNSIMLIRDHIQQLRDGGPATPAHLNSLFTAAQHVRVGFTVQEIGFVNGGLDEDEALKIVEDCAEGLHRRAAQLAPEAMAIADALTRHEYPKTPYEMALFLGLAMNTADQVKHIERISRPAEA